MFRFSVKLFFFIAFSTVVNAQVSVLTQHNNTLRTGWNDQETVLNQQNVSSEKFGLTSTLAVDDQIYGQILVATNVSIGGFTGAVLFAATVNNTVYAFNADDVSQPAPLWQINLNPPGQRTPNIFDLVGPIIGRPCGGNYRDFSGNLGLISTPVIDTSSGTIYVVVKTVDDAGNFSSYLNALDISNGQHKPGSPHLIAAEVSGTGEGSSDSIIAYNSKIQNQRPALLLYNNTVYVASASHCDWGPYHGWILGFDATTLDLLYTYNATPHGWAGGIWMAGQGISVGDDGNLYASTGNGTTGADNNDPTGGRSESLLKLSPELELLDWFTPANYEYLDIYDLDYGCDGVLMIPNTSLTVSGSKEGLSYVVDYNNMGRLTPDNAQVTDTLIFNPSNTGYVHVHGSPVYAQLNSGEFVYAWAESFKIRQFEFDRDANLFLDDFKQGIRNLDNGMPGAMLSLSSNLMEDTTAIVWACFPTSGNANNQLRPGTISAYRANDVSEGEIWHSDMNPRDKLGNFAKFNSPTIANGKVFAPTFSNCIKVYGLACDSALTNIQYGEGIGLKAAYYSNTAGDDFPAEPDMVKLDKSVNHNWGTEGPLPGISSDDFKVRWSGQLRPLTDDDYTIYVTAGDGVRLWINNMLAIDHWTAGEIHTYTHTLALQTDTEYDIVLEYYSLSNIASCILQWSAPGICREVIPTSQLFAPLASCVGSGSGLNAEYFSNIDIAAPFPETPTVSVTVPTIDFDWELSSPAAGISEDFFKARFTGYVQSTDAGTYTFIATVDDGVRLWVNDQLLIDAWVDQAETEYEAEIHLEACTAYPIRMEYYENGGDASCKLAWNGPIFDNEVVGESQLLTDLLEVPPGEKFMLYPNPAKDLITIESGGHFKQHDLIRIYDMLGRKVNHSIFPVTGSTKMDIPIGFLANGVYIMTIISGESTYSIKFIKS